MAFIGLTSRIAYVYESFVVYLIYLFGYTFMSFSQLDRITLAAKALAGGVIDADPVAQWYESTLPFSFALPADKVWTQATEVRANPAANLAEAQANAAGPLLGIVDDLSASASSIRLTPVPGVNNTYVALSTFGDFSSPLLDNWLSPVFAPRTNGLPSVGYAVRLYDGNPALGGTEVLTTDGTTGTGVNKSVAWMFNYAGGLLLLSSDFSVADPYITGFRYIGNAASSPVAGTSRRSYGTCSVALSASTPYPATAMSVTQTAERSGGHIQLISEFSNYSRSTARLSVYDLSNNLLVSDEQVFPTLNDLVSWINANVPHGASTFNANCNLEMFDTIDPEIVPPAKVYGKNRVWASLVAKAPGRFYHRPKTASAFHAINYGPSARLSLATVLNEMWILLYGNTMPAPADWTADEFGCFWIGRNKHRKYAMPSTLPGVLTTNGSTDRRVRDIVALTTSSLVGFYGYDTAAGLPTAYGSLDSFGNVPISPAFSPTAAFSELATRIMSGHSVLVGYPMKPGIGDFRSVYLKPVGMDHFFFDSFDATKYRLEAVGVQGTRHHPRIYPLSVSQAPYHRSSGIVTGVELSGPLGYSAEKSRAFPGRHSYKLGTAKFQYRDLVTNRVSPVASAYVTTIWRRRMIPFGLMVRNNVDR